MGWKLIDLKVDYQRMGIPNDYWEITDANKDYEVILAQSGHVMQSLFLLMMYSRSGASGEE